MFLTKKLCGKERGGGKREKRDRQRKTIEKPYPVHAQVPHEAG